MLLRQIFLVGGCLGILLGCSSKNNPTSAVEKGGSISFKISIAADSPFKKIAKSAEINITAHDMIAITKPLEIKDSTIEGKIDNIPSGKNRKFEIRVYDSTGTERYRGSVSGDIKPDSTVSISLPIHRVVGSAIINGSVIELPIELTDTGTLALFNFDEGAGTVTTDSKNGIVGSLNNVNWVKSPLGYAAKFNGTNSSIGMNSSSFVTLKDTFTVDIIFRTGNTTERRFIFGMRQPQDISAEITEAGKFRAILHDGNESTHLVSLDSVDDGKWHYASIIHKKESSTLFLNGVKQQDSTNSNLNLNNSTNILFGHLNLGEFPGRFFFAGELEMVRFSKVARSATEVQAINSLIRN